MDRRRASMLALAPLAALTLWSGASGTSRAVVPAAGSPVAPPVVPAAPAIPAHPTSADLARIQAYVAGLTTTAQRAADRVTKAADAQAYLAVELGEARDNADAATATLDAAVRTAYEAGGGSDTIGLLAGLSPSDAEAGRQATANALQVDTSLVAAKQDAGATVARISAQVDQSRLRLLADAAPVEAAEAKAEVALDAATSAFAADQAALAKLAAQRAALATASEQVAFDVTPAVTAAGQAAAAAQAPILSLLDRTPPGAVPAGYHRTGKTVSGISSWYGPGFVGRNTSSGSPYDPEQLTCAMLAVPLGTLVRVTTAAGGVVTVLVTDHGPYAGVDRVIDLSERAAGIAGVGLTPVTIEVLEPNGA